MRKRFSIFLMAVAIGITSVSCPASIYARNPVVQNGVGPDNITIKTTYSKGLNVGSLDMYRIYYSLLDADDQLGHIDIDADDASLSARVAPGDYQVVRIKYIGSSKELKKEPVATKTFFRVYNDQVTTIPIAIGEDAVEKLTDKIGLGSIYKEMDVNSSISDTKNYNEVTLNSPYMDEAVFGDDDVREAYLQELMDSGYLDENGTLTSSGKAIQEALDEKGLKYETARQNAIIEGVSLEEYLGLTEDRQDASSENESSYKNNQEEASSGDAEETRFDDENSNETDSKTNTIKKRFISSLISICILVIVLFGVLIYIKKKY